MTQFTIDAPTVIRAKRDGRRLTDAQIDWIIDAYTRGDVGDGQMAALLMAIYLNGMDGGEIARWTAAMIDSGVTLDFSDLGLPLIDKHSTGGVGDKTTIALLPVVAVCGLAVPQAAGRGLGHTGGTLDKLESIAGFSAEIGVEAIRRQLLDVGAAVFAAGDLAPADRKIYALRDVTACVESLPLIASSIMSKKLAEGADALVLDVKFGSGAFMKSQTDARALAQTMVDLGTARGVPTRALLTDMQCPLGRTVGNAIEVQESLEVLAGGGPADVVELTVALAREMCALAGRDAVDPADTLADGTAMDRFRMLVAAQGGDLARPLPLGCHSETVTAPGGGTMGDIDAFAVGLAVWRLGAGRTVPGERVSPGAGLRIHRKPGEPVVAGEPLFTLYSDTPERLAPALAELDGAYCVGAPPARRPLIVDRIGS